MNKKDMERRYRKRQAKKHPPANLEFVADAVEVSIQSYEQKNLGMCFLRASLASYVLTEIEKRRWFIQAGGLSLFSNPSDPTLRLQLRGESISDVTRGEFHCWIASDYGKIVDFSARDYRKYVEDLARIETEEVLVWNLPEPPKYLAITQDSPRLPWVSLDVAKNPTVFLSGQVDDQWCKTMTPIVITNYNRLYAGQKPLQVITGH